MRHRPLLATGFVAAALAFAPAQSEPFFEDMTQQSRAYGLELVGVRLAIVAAFHPLPAELEEVVEGIFEHDLPRFVGTLEALDPDVAEALVQALDQVEEGVEDGEVGIMDLAYARAWTQAAYDLVVPAEQRVEAIWAELLPMANAEEASFARQYLDFLGEIYATPAPPEVLPANPEEAEAPAQSLVGIIEAVVDASLYTGREFGRLAGALVDEVATACAAYAAGDDAVALETVAAVATHYETNLENLLDLFAPELAEVAGYILEALLGVEDDDEGGPSSSGDDDDDDEDEDGLDEPAEVCMELMEALEEARTLLGG